MHLKHFKITIYEISALCIIIFAVVLRIMLISQRWPATNSDEGTIGIMALHIAYRRQHPIFFYGQGYMGPLEAYLAALLFKLFGPSLFLVRMGLIILLALFFISTYLLTTLLYSKKLALLTLLVLSLGSIGELMTQLRAIGGYAETLLFASLLLLLATVLAYSYRSNPSLKWRLLRYSLYCCWGYLVGAGIWTDLLILPIVVMSGFFLLVLCWPDLDSLAPSCVIASFTIGILPSLIYNIRSLPQKSTLFYFLLDYRSDPATGLPIRHVPLLQKVAGALLLGLPDATGANPICAVQYRHFSGLFSRANLHCTLLQGSWSLGAILLWLSAVVLTLLVLWQRRREVQKHFIDTEARFITVRYCARLMLLGYAALTFILFTLSPVAAIDPWNHSRYLICLLIATPAILAPLWKDEYSINVILSFLLRRSKELPPQEREIATLGTSPSLFKAVSLRRLALEICSASVLIYICTLLVLGTINTFKTVSPTQAWNKQQDTLIAHLLQMRATRIYSEYWTCNRLIFASDEHIICSVIGDNLYNGYNRYQPYYFIVKQDTHAPYVLPLGSPVALNFARRLASTHSNRHYRRSIVDGYVIYQPT